MNLPRKLIIRVAGAAALGTAVYLAFFFRSPVPVQAQNAAPPTRTRGAVVAAPADGAPVTAAAPATADVPPPGVAGQVPAGANAPAAGGGKGQATLPAETPTESTNTIAKAVGEEEMQLSFQNANVDTIVQWLAKNTGKSVVKHP